MKIIRILVASVALYCYAPISQPGDTNGRFWLGGGTGGVKCPQFVASMEKARSLGIGSVRYVEETQGFTMFLEGFRTGYNLSTPDTCDIFSAEEKEYPLLSWVENYCRINSTSRFGDAVVALAKERHWKRLRVCPK